MGGSQPGQYDVQRLRRQDPETFARLVNEHQAIVQGLCRSMGLRGADVEDAAAEAFADVYLALPRFDGRSKVGTYVYRIACRAILRTQAGIRRSRSVPDTGKPSKPPHPTPQEILEGEETRRRIWEAVAGLDPRQAVAVELHYRREWSVEEIATVMECPAGTVKTLLFRAREELRRIFLREEITP